ncbi:hypothetical protein LY474_06400 [Myxococcus stipitatus]|uniref:hypothetical protein n=1 Tax=Myxococcus stipitatus TaxID=83455 RepID=UPI001F3273FF|nr:hypothetical protein [Myxococcus stipitatus]MCE9667441.1 hypothetical protein [Myxococcus stipitatus]
MAAESCKLCGKLRVGEDAGEHGFCPLCLERLAKASLGPKEALSALTRRPRLQLGPEQLIAWIVNQLKPSTSSGSASRKKGAKEKSKKGGASGSKGGKGTSEKASQRAPNLLLPHQKRLDRVYHQRLKCPWLKIAVQARESGGFGDLINCLNTSKILLECDEAWDVFADCNHAAFDIMLPSFPGVRDAEGKGLDVGSPEVVRLDMVAKGGSVMAGAVDEYGYRDGNDPRSPYQRIAGLGDDEVGIMINPSLREQQPLSSLSLQAEELGGMLARPEVQGARVFFGYGAGGKSPHCFHILLDRVLFDPSITDAVILAVGYSSGHLDQCLGNQARAKALKLTETHPYKVETFKPSKKEKLQLPTSDGKEKEKVKVGGECRSLLLALNGRTIRVLFNSGSLPYSDMLQLWRVADRSFTICEGDQSFSEAISAGIPMAYQLWNPTGGSPPHKTKLFQDFVALCARSDKNIADFLLTCDAYRKQKFDQGLVDRIVRYSSSHDFVASYRECMREISQEWDIASVLPGFVKRLWLRKLVELGAAGPLTQDLEKLFAWEGSPAFSLPGLEAELYRISQAVPRLAYALAMSSSPDSVKYFT